MRETVLLKSRKQSGTFALGYVLFVLGFTNTRVNYDYTGSPTLQRVGGRDGSEAGALQKAAEM